jgi:hypothetical protein
LVKFAKIVLANNELKRVFGMFSGKSPKGVNGVRGFWHAKLDITYAYVRLICARQLCHSQAMFLRGQPAIFFEGILRTNNQPNFVEWLLLQSLKRYVQVSVVNGVK